MVLCACVEKTAARAKTVKAVVKQVVHRAKAERTNKDDITAVLVRRPGPLGLFKQP